MYFLLKIFNNLKYVFIDDPVSSLDDNHLIELAENLASLLKKAENLKFIITTHNPLFYNVLWNALNSTNYRLVKKTDGSFELSVLNNDRPFSYHLFLLSSIQKAIQNNAVSVNKVKVTDPNAALDFEKIRGKYILVGNGKQKNYILSFK